MLFESVVPNKMVHEDKTKIRPLSAALQKVAEEELKETPEKMIKHLKTLNDWIKQQPHLRRVKPTNQWLVAFLRGCKYDVEKAKGKIDMYYTMKATVPEFYSNRDPLDPGIQEILKSGPFLPLKQCAKDDAPRVCLSRIGTNTSLVDYIKVCLMILEILLLEDDNYVVAGEDIIADLKNIGFRLVIQWTPALARKTITSSEKALSVRMKNLHIINPIFGLPTALAIFKMFLGPKIRNRIQTYNKDFEKLYECLDKSILPEEYGGSGDSIQELTDYWKQKVESYRDWFMDETAFSDESKRADHKKPFGGFFS